MRNIVHNYDQVVFGSNMSALLYAYVNQIPLFYSYLDKPNKFEFFDPSFKFPNINDTNIYELNSNQVNMGTRKQDLWDRIFFVHNLAGYMPLSNNVSSVRIDENTLKITTKNSRVLTIKFNHMTLFDENLDGLPQTNKINNVGIIYDYFKFNNLHEHKNVLFKTGEDFVNQVWIEDKDAFIVTKVENILDEVPDYAIKFRVLDLAKEHGFKGKQNGIYHYRKELKIPRFNKLDGKLTERLIKKISLNDYAFDQSLTFVQPSDIVEKQLLIQLKPNEIWNHLIR